jgi:hypothetical protein
VHDELRRALDVVRSDVVRSGLDDLVVDDRDWCNWSRQTGAMLQSPYGHGQGVSVMIGESPDAQLASVADQVQEFIHEGILWYGGKPVVWPQCPLHPDSHPLAPVVDGTQGPVWTCPRSAHVVARIGALPASP